MANQQYRISSEQRKLRAELESKNRLQKHWGELKPGALAAVVDDIRARVVEEGWFGKPLQTVGSALTDQVKFHELYGQRQELEAASEQLHSVQMSDLYGNLNQEFNYDRDNEMEL